MRSFK